MTKQTECKERVVCIRHDPTLIDDQDKILKQVLRGDTYVLGKMWIDFMKAVLVGGKLNVFPTVKAAGKEEVPQKPPPMKYTDLPTYECPHREYKQYLADKDKHPHRNSKPIHQTILPTVREHRRNLSKYLALVKKELQEVKKEIGDDFSSASKRIKAFLTDPKNLALRQGLVACGGLTGLYMARRKSMTLKLMYIGAGSLLAASQTFPRESDEIVRTIFYHTGQGVVKFYNFFHGLNAKIRERPPCPIDEKKD